MKCPYDAHNLHCGHPHCIERDPRCMEAHTIAKALTERPALKQRPGDQPLPAKNDHAYCADMLVERLQLGYAGPSTSRLTETIQTRKAIGIERYGTALQPFNGRDFLRDLLEELVDAAKYSEGLMFENANIGIALQLLNHHDNLVRYASYVQHLIMKREEAQSV